ncbi:winged helix-turn-helix domain-containing protein [Pseudoalteromonas phenolica]|uniref:winged helix-turn-helix domain-containing protein n=1 Tax=Pseudoalteromonas phenolica TaxID=161398 RepID=UPI001485E1F2|nr:winged helix-turn-helix domain-containing protein [Pseudoalteromonas phenolica]
MLDANITQVKFADWLLLTRSCSLVSDGTTQELTPLNYKILCYFVLNPNRIVSRDEFISSVWENHYVDDNAINKAISDLRRILKSSDSAQILIKTHYKKGYSFVGDVEFVREIKVEDTDKRSSQASEENVQQDHHIEPILNSYEQEKSVSAQKKFSQIFSTKFFLSILAIFIFVSAGSYWFAKEPSPIQFESKKLSISDDSIYFSLSPSPSNEKLAVTKENVKTGIDEIFLIDLDTHKNTKIISEQHDSYPIGWASNSNSIYYQIINNALKVCEIWRADFKVSNEVSFKEKVLDCNSQYILSMVTDEQHNRIIYTKFGYRNVSSLSALVARDLETGEEFQVTSPNIDSYGDRFVSLSPNKEKIAFVRRQTGISQIHIANPDGSMQRKVHETNESINRVEWDEGSQILLWYEARSRQLFSYDMNLASLKKTSVSPNNYSNIVVSSDTFIATTKSSDADIYIYSTDAKTFKQVTDTKNNEFSPISSEKGFYFFTNNEGLMLNSYSNGELTVLPSALNMDSLVGGEFNKSDGLMALYQRNKIVLYKPDDNEVVDSFVIENRIVHLAWLNKTKLLLILEGSQSEQHIWTLDLESEKLQKIIHNDARRVFKTSANKIIYQDFYNNLHLFDPTEGTSQLLVSLKGHPYINWRYLDNHIYYTTGSDLIKYSLETQKETVFFNENSVSDSFILEFSVIKNKGLEKFILQIHRLRSNDVVLLERFK